jgi:putative ABC transport system permease protein
VTLNKLRTFLSLLGVTIGIISIVSIFTVLDSMENNIRSSFEMFGNDIVIIEKWPWNVEEGDDEYAWWEYMNRPVPTAREYELISERIHGAASCFVGAVGANIEFMNRHIANTELWGISEELVR